MQLNRKQLGVALFLLVGIVSFTTLCWMHSASTTITFSKDMAVSTQHSLGQHLRQLEKLFGHSEFGVALFNMRRRSANATSVSRGTTMKPTIRSSMSIGSPALTSGNTAETSTSVDRGKATRETKPVGNSDHGHRLAIIVPYRDRAKNLEEFLLIVTKLCKEQEIEFRIFIIEQTARGAFNRAKLCNIGYKIASEKNFDYFIFHDVDKVPMTSSVNYRYHEKNPKHMAHCVAQFAWRLPYGAFAGGVLMVTKEQFAKVNGMSNIFWGWGGEDDELYHRFLRAGYRLDRDEGCDSGKFRSLQHAGASKSYPGVKYEENYRLYMDTMKKIRKTEDDGLNTLDFEQERLEETEQFCRVVVDVCKGYLGRASPAGAGCDVKGRLAN